MSLNDSRGVSETSVDSSNGYDAELAGNRSANDVSTPNVSDI